MAKIRLPNNWEPRPYQRPLWSYLERGGKRAIAIWHRRSGKDDLALHWTACAAVQRVGVYWHMLPEAAQARKAIWDAVNPHTGIRRIDEAFPAALRATTREQEMMIRFQNGSTWQVVGSDNFDSLVGSPPVGIVFSEWALANPSSWAYLRPILAENGGWSLFITTPRGRNHAAVMYDAGRQDPEWYSERLPATETRVFTPDQLEAERLEYVRELGVEIGEALFRQEYLCDFNAAILGSYYGHLLEAAEFEGRLTSVPYDPQHPVDTAWDLGVGDSTAIWCVQQVGREIRVIDYYEASGVGLDHYAKWLQSRPYVYGEHILPHDAGHKELGTGRTRVETLLSYGIRATVLPRISVDDGINAARLILPRCWFDAGRCKRGIEALRQYKRDWDDKAKTFKPAPRHDWASHGADAFRYLALGLEEKRDRRGQMVVRTSPDPRSKGYNPLRRYGARR